MNKPLLPLDHKPMPTDWPALNLPATQAKARPGSALRARALARWAEDLPRGNTTVAAHQLLARLQEMNITRYSVRERLQLQNTLRPLLAELVLAVRRPLRDADLPLSHSLQYNANLLQDLLEAMSCGYKLVVNELAMTRRLKEYNQLLLQEAIYLAIRYLSQRLLEAYSQYMREPAHVWMDLNQLYQYATRKELQHDTIDDPYPDQALPLRHTIDSAYKRILLLTLAEPYHLMQHEVTEIYQLVGASVQDCSLEPFSELITQGEYVIDLDADEGPRYVALDSRWRGSDPRIVDITQVKSQLNRHLQHLLRQNIHGTDLDSAPLMERQQRDMLLRLADAWNAALVRKNQRFHLQAGVELTMGLNAGHYFIANGARFTPEVNALKLTHALDQLDDPRHSIFAAVYRDALQKDRMHARHPYRLHRWLQRDVSPLGIALHREHSDQSLDASVGELVCYRFTEKRLQRWQLGVVRWLKTQYTETEPGTIDIGVMNLATGALPVGVKAVKGVGNGTDYFRSLLIPRQVSLQQIRSLLVPALIYDVGTILVINMKQRLMYVRLTRVLRSTRAFTQFDFEVVSKPVDFIL